MNQETGLTMSKSEMNMRYRQGTPLSVVAELNGVVLRDVLPWIDGLEELASKIEPMDRKEEFAYWVSEGYSDLEICRMLDITQVTAQSWRRTMGIKANSNGVPVVLIDKHGNETRYPSGLAAIRDTDLTEWDLFTACLKRGETRKGYRAKFDEKVDLNLAEKSVDVW